MTRLMRKPSGFLIHRLCFQIVFGYLYLFFLIDSSFANPQGSSQTLARSETFRAYVDTAQNASRFLGFSGYDLSLDVEDSLLGYCRLPTLPQISDLAVLSGQCLASQEASAFSFNIDFDSDLAICSCLKAQPAISLQQTTFQAANPDPKLHPNYLKQKHMNFNIDRLNRILEAEQNAMQFQASTLPASDSNIEGLISTFTNRVNFNVSERVSTVQTQAEKAYNTASDLSAPENSRLPMNRIVVRPANGDLVSPPLEAGNYIDQVNICLPVRAFMTANQIPKDPFYEDLASLGTEYKQTDWDYHQLKLKFVQMSSAVNTLEDARKDPQAEKIYQRIRFLEKNPLYRNLFSSNHASAPAKKQELYNKIRNAYGPQVIASQRLEKFEALRYETGSFFTSSPVMEAIVQDGASVNLANVMREVPERVSQISLEYRPSGDWFETAVLMDDRFPAIADQPTSNNRQNIAFYESYCPKIEFSSQQNQFRVLKELEDSFGLSYQSNPWLQPEYVNFNQKFCSNTRISKDGKTRTSWADHYEKICGGQTTGNCHPDNQPALVAAFIDEFPGADGDSPSREELEFILPILKGQSRVPAPSREVTQRAVRNGADPRFSTSSNMTSTIRALNSDFADGSRNLSSEEVSQFRSSSAVVASNTSSSFSRTQSNLISTPQTFNQGQLISPSDNVLAPVTPTTINNSTPEVLRRQIGQNESETSELQTQFDDLKKTLREREALNQSSTPQESVLLADMRSRLARLEAELNSKKQENARLRRQRRSPNNPTPNSESEGDVDDEELESRISNAGPAQVQAGPQNNQQSAAQLTSMSLPQATAALSGNSRGTSLAPVSRSVASRDVNLARFGVQSVSTQGSITVADRSPSIDYQSLRVESAEKVQNVILSPDDFNKLQNNDQEALNSYVERLRQADPGVYRFAISTAGSGNQMDLFVVKTLSGISIIPPEIRNRGFASDAPPVPEVAPERIDQLDVLRKIVAP